MNYYVGIRETMIERARVASSAVLGEVFGTRLAHTPLQGDITQNEMGLVEAQPIDITGVTKIGATGLEPATS
jgi:hypothetical protein